MEVKMIKKSLILTAAALCLMVTTPATAESTLTVEDIVNIFQKQKTRGLVLAPATSDDEATDVDNFVSLPKEEQVNLNIEFDFDSTVLRPDQDDKLALLCAAMKAVNATGFKIVGHTDASGTQIYNMNLSKLRAQEVKRHLVDNCGIPEEKLWAEGAGEGYLFDESNPDANINRRVEFQVAG